MPSKLTKEMREHMAANREQLLAVRAGQSPSRGLEPQRGHLRWSEVVALVSPMRPLVAELPHPESYVPGESVIVAPPSTQKSPKLHRKSKRQRGMEEESFLDQIDSGLLTANLIKAKLCSWYPDEDWSFVNEVDVYKDLDTKEEGAAVDADVLGGDVGTSGAQDALGPTIFAGPSIKGIEPAPSSEAIDDPPVVE
ncbi:hypothetical protein JCGZ_17452 [Jatropha curcas]|uniref:Uncharacterized protein n=1 Tax=Jatropha curcas TaxID=180498 RepID=A0A067LK87_JATCU|nr:hypothetical protein JCGZ_17452 [Jatropha curcas]